MMATSAFSKFIGGWSVIALELIFILCLSSFLFSGASPDGSIQAKRATDLLREIYEEVVQLPRLENENFIKGEFHINLDGNEENKEEHILILDHFSSGQEKMLLQVTYFESRRKNSPVKYAKCTREIECCIREGRVEIERCDYDNSEIDSLLPGILDGIRETKRFLKRRE